ncbi:MAG: ribonuclease J, partial [Desulfitobacterium sp.]|nr:ribonuclease J [Desulfitobacterium sp.]
LIIGLTRPKFLIPHHGEIRHQHAFRKLASQMGYDNSQMALTKIGSKVVLTGGKMVMAERVESGSVYVDGLGIGDVGEIVLRDRQQLSRDGVVIVVAVLSKGYPTSLVYGPEITSRGFTFMKEAEELVEGAKKIALASIETQLQREKWEWGALRGGIQESLNRYFWEKTRRNPMILPVLLRF